MRLLRPMVCMENRLLCDLLYITPACSLLVTCLQVLRKNAAKVTTAAGGDMPAANDTALPLLQAQDALAYIIFSRQATGRSAQAMHQVQAMRC